MRTHVGLAAVVLAIGSLLTACAEAPESDVDIEQPALAPKGNGGSIGINGFGDGDLDDAMGGLVHAQQTHAAKAPGSTSVNNQIITELLSTSAGVNAFRYAAVCSFPPKTYLETDTDVFNGKGHLESTGGWLDNALTPSQSADLFTCLATHLNPLGVHVDIYLTGANVRPDGEKHEDFTVQEALWVSTLNIDGSPTFHVLPMQDFIGRCSNYSDAFQYRVCGQHPQNCRLEMMAPADCDYDSTSDTWTCLHIPAVETWLRPADVPVLHPRCVP